MASPDYDLDSGGPFTPIILPCGRRIRNRLVKVALYEHLASFLGGLPNRRHLRLYSIWSKYDWGMIITGNVQVSSSHLSLGRDIVVPNEVTEETLKSFKDLASAIHGNNGSSNSSNPLAIMQLSHAGRQSLNIIGGRRPFHPPVGPSAIRIKGDERGLLSGLLHRIAFQTPKAMSEVEILDTIAQFVKGAKMALESGFDGIQLHAAHGYLLSQFMSPKSNHRADKYSADEDNALRLLSKIVFAIREVVPDNFIVGVKVNAADYAYSMGSKGRASGHVQKMASWNALDFIEISGGDYERPEFLSSSSSSRQAFFSRFSRQAVQSLKSMPPDPLRRPLPLILLTGGLNSPKILSSVLVSNHAHLLGIGRASLLCPDLPHVLLKRLRDNSELDTPFLPGPTFSMHLPMPLECLWNYIPRIPLIGAGVETAWYTVRMRRLRINQEISGPDYNYGSFRSVFYMWVWIDERSPLQALLMLVSLIVSLLVGMIAIQQSIVMALS